MNIINTRDGYTLVLDDSADREGDVWLELYNDAEIGTDSLYISREAGQALVNHLSEAQGVTPQGAVRASDVSLNEGLLRLAGVHNVPVTFKYAKAVDKPIETRTFVPSQVKDKGDHVTFVGYDEDRGGIRSFRSDRIKGQVSL